MFTILSACYSCLFLSIYTIIIHADGSLHSLHYAKHEEEPQHVERTADPQPGQIPWLGGEHKSEKSRLPLQNEIRQIRVEVRDMRERLAWNHYTIASIATILVFIRVP